MHACLDCVRTAKASLYGCPLLEYIHPGEQDKGATANTTVLLSLVARTTPQQRLPRRHLNTVQWTVGPHIGQRLTVSEGSLEAERVYLSKQQLGGLDTRIAGQRGAQFAHVSVNRETEANAHLPRRLVQVENGDDNRSHRSLRYRQRDAEERVEGVGLTLTGGTSETGPELGLEDVNDEAVVAARVVGERLRRQHVIGTARGVAYLLVLFLRCHVEFLVDLVQQPEQELLGVVLAAPFILAPVLVHFRQEIARCL
jgi:hypothetical protein